MRYGMPIRGPILTVNTDYWNLEAQRSRSRQLDAKHGMAYQDLVGLLEEHERLWMWTWVIIPRRWFRGEYLQECQRAALILIESAEQFEYVVTNYGKPRSTFYATPS